MPAHRFWTFCGLCLYLTMVAWGAIPGETQRLFGSTSDKVLHFTAYAVLATCFHAGRRGSSLARGGWTVGVIALLGALDEAIQLHEPHRTSDVRDWVTDVAAALAVSLLFAWWHGRRRAAPRPG